MVDRIDRKIQRATKVLPRRSSDRSRAKLAILTVGGCHAACGEALDQLAREGIALDYMRVRSFPFGDEVGKFIESHDPTFVVEQNRDAQRAIC